MILIFPLKKMVFLLLQLAFVSGESAWAHLIIYPETEVELELKVYDGLIVTSLYRGMLTAGEKHVIDTPYHGLALLVFTGGQQYPIIINDKASAVTLTSPDLPPSFPEHNENYSFYRFLAGEKGDNKLGNFALLLLQAKQLLESSHSIHSIEELRHKKQAFQDFVCGNYKDIARSDMLRRLIAQYFMMHEYVSYHKEDQPAEKNRIGYQQEVLGGVESWLAVLQGHIPENEVLNYCVGLYYDRGMVTLGSIIVNHFKKMAYCAGEEQKQISLPDNLSLVTSNGSTAGKLGAFRGEKIISFVSADCPISMVMTVIKAREIVESENFGNAQFVVVIPMETLSERYFAMNRNVSGGALLFVDDESWRKENFHRDKRLPLMYRLN